jgi:hypothetical protein
VVRAELRRGVLVLEPERLVDLFGRRPAEVDQDGVAVEPDLDRLVRGRPLRVYLLGDRGVDAARYGLGPGALVVFGPVQLDVDPPRAPHLVDGLVGQILDGLAVVRRGVAVLQERHPEQVQPVLPHRCGEVITVDLHGHRHPRRPHPVLVGAVEVGIRRGEGPRDDVQGVAGRVGGVFQVNRADVQPRQRLQSAQVGEQRLAG